MSAISSLTSGTAATLEGTTSRLPQKVLGQNDFLKLLATQFQVQDPMKPMEDTAFIAQMAQFSALDQSSSMSRDMTALRADQQRVTANSYLGHHVTMDLGDGATASGDVLAVDLSGSEPRLVIGDKTFPLSAVLRVEPGVVTASPPATSSGT